MLIYAVKLISFVLVLNVKMYSKKLQVKSFMTFNVTNVQRDFVLSVANHHISQWIVSF